jgi:hypothetical protein
MTVRMPRLTAAAVAAAALAVAGCGGGSGDSASAPAPAAETATPTATATPTPAQPTPTPSATATPTATPTAGVEDQQGGAGDEAAPRVPVEIRLAPGEGVVPQTVSVPAFLGLELIVHNDGQGEAQVRVQGAAEGEPLVVPAGAVGRRRLEGLRAGNYKVDAGAAGSATLVVGAEPGP